MSRIESSPPAADLPLDVVPVLEELNDLKRIRSAKRSGSIASRLFDAAWRGLVSGAEPEALAFAVTARALAAARLGDLDDALLREAGIPPEKRAKILSDAARAVGGALFGRAADAMERGISTALPGSAVSLPSFVALLDAQPRAGVTCPGKPRILLEPPENHAEHCLVVAVYGVLLAPFYGANAGRVFVAALAHHFHNAGMPDSGFTGEMLLGDALEPMIAHFNARCIAELDAPLRALVEDARTILPDDATPDGRAFHAADVLDRVLQIMQYTRAAALTPERMLGDMELVHDGPVKGFQDAVLRQAGLLV